MATESATIPTKPDADAFNAAQKSLNDTIETLKKKRERLQEKVAASKRKNDELLASIKESREKFDAGRSELTAAKDRRSKIIEELKHLQAETSRLSEEAKAARSKIKFGSLEEIDGRIATLTLRQETESIPLKEERELIREIESLRAQRSGLAASNERAVRNEATREAAISRERELRASLDPLTLVWKEMNERQSAAFEALKAMQAERDAGKAAMLAAMKERDEVNAAVGAKLGELKTLRDSHYSAVRTFEAFASEQRRAKAEAAAKERAAAAEAGTEANATATGAPQTATAAEDLEFHPHADKLLKCDNLLQFLNKLKPKAATVSAAAVEAGPREILGAKGEKIVALNRDLEKDEGLAFLMGGGKKGKKAPAAAKAAVAPRAQTLSFGFDTIATLRELDITPPATSDDLDEAIAAVRAKRAHFEVLPAPAAKGSAAVAAGPGEKFGRKAAKTSGAGAVPVAKNGDRVRTPYGPATVTAVRDNSIDGHVAGGAVGTTVVVKLEGVGATAYLAPDQVLIL